MTTENGSERSECRVGSLAIITRSYAVLTRSYAVLTRSYTVLTRSYTVLTRSYAVLTRSYAVLTRSYAVLTRSYAVLTRSYAVLTLYRFPLAFSFRLLMTSSHVFGIRPPSSLNLKTVIGRIYIYHFAITINILNLLACFLEEQLM